MTDMKFIMQGHSASKQPQFQYMLAGPPDAPRPDSLMPSEQAAAIPFTLAPNFCWGTHASLRQGFSSLPSYNEAGMAMYAKLSKDDKYASPWNKNV